MQGHVHNYADGRKTTTWYVVIELGRDADGRPRQKWHGGYHTPKDARGHSSQARQRVNTGVYAAPTKVTLPEWITEHWETGLVFRR